MKSLVSLTALVLAGATPALASSGQAGAPYPVPRAGEPAQSMTVAEESQATGPRGSSQPAAGERRFDEVGFASVGNDGGVAASVRGLVAGEYAEITAVDSGRTIAVSVVDGDVPAGRIATLSPRAAAQLGIEGTAFGLRVRRIAVTPQDAMQLRAGTPATTRDVAPPVLLAALRRKLGPPPAPAAPLTSTKLPSPKPRPPASTRAKVPAPIPSPAKAAPPPAIAKTPPQPAAARPTPAPAPVAGGFYVQIASLSNAGHAKALATKVRGTTRAAGAMTRVQMGPYANQAAAERGRADAVRLGYRGAQIVRIAP